MDPLLTRRALLTASGSSLLLAGCDRPLVPRGGVYTLRMADGFPPNHQVVELIIEPFIRRAEELSEGRLRFERFPSEQLGKLRDMLRLTQWGLMDMAYITPAFNAEKLPLSSVHDLPRALGQDIGEGVHVLEGLYQEGTVLWETETHPQGIRPFLYISAAPAQLELASSRRIEVLSDLEGLKLRIASPATEELVKALGAVPIRLATGEIFEALIRGTIDGLMMAAGSVHAYDLGGLLTQMTTDLNFGSIAGTYALREQSWRSLPPDLRQVIIEAGSEASASGSREVQARESRLIEEILELGVRPVTLPQADRAELDRRIDGVYLRWAEQMEAIGRPGNAALAELARVKALAGVE